MLTIDQYEILNDVRKRTDPIIDGVAQFASEFLSSYNRDDLWKFFKENSFVEGERFFSSITFQGRVALAAYEDNNDAQSI